MTKTPKGAFFLAAAQPDFQNTHPLYTFVPYKYLAKGELNEDAYLRSGQGTVNCACNWEKGIGTHLLPDLKKPLEKKDIPEAFLQNLEHYHLKTLGKLSPHKLPGKNQESPNPER